MCFLEAGDLQHRWLYSLSLTGTSRFSFWEVVSFTSKANTTLDSSKASRSWVFVRNMLFSALIGFGGSPYFSGPRITLFPSFSKE
jgi:hypothetical protein